MTLFARARRPAARGVALAAAASMAALPAMSAYAQTVGINAAIRNDVQIRGAGAPQPRPAVLRQRVGLADEVRTGSRSQLQILLLDRSTFTVGANARLTIDRFVYDPRRSVRSVGATVTRGAFRFMSGRALGLSSDTRSIRTPVATIGIRGTIVDGVVGGDAIDIAAGEPAVGPEIGGDSATASLIILRGPGPAAERGTGRGVIDVQAGGRALTLDSPSLAVYVPRPGAAPIGPFLISRAGLIRVQQLLTPPLSLAPALASGPASDADAGPAPAGGQDDRVELAAPVSDQGPAQPPPGGQGPADRPGFRPGPLLFLGAAALIVALVVIFANGNGTDGRPQSP